MEGINFLLKIGAKHYLDSNGDSVFAQIAESSGILDTLEELQVNQNQKVYDKAVEILETYF